MNSDPSCGKPDVVDRPGDRFDSQALAALGATDSGLSMQALAVACRLFMERAYPDGRDTIPVNRRPYLDMTTADALTDYLPPAAFAVGVCQELCTLKGDVRGYEFRLGSTAHPHLKLRVQLMSLHQQDIWVFSVDTHDRIVAQAAAHLNAEESAQWRALLDKNSMLKHEIENALAEAGHYTPKGVLRLDLTSSK